jgi:type I restriction enzyme S subunit
MPSLINPAIEGWTTMALEDCAKFIDYRGRTPKKTESGLRLITAKNAKMGYLQLEPREFVAPESYDAWMTRGIPLKGDVIFTTEAPLGNVCQLDTDEKVVFAQRIITLQTDREMLNPSFLKYTLMSPQMQSIILEQATGATVSGIKAKLLKKVEISFPSLSEQQRIVSLLDEAFVQVGIKITQAEQKLYNGKELFQSVIANIFSQKGEGWNEKTLGEMCENLDRMRIPITKNKRVSGEIPYYGASGIVDYVKDYIFDEDLLLVSEDGANLLARTYPIAFSISGKTWVNNHAHVLRFETMVTQRFMEYYLNSIRLEPYVSGMAQPKLNQKSLNSIPVPEPPLNRQQAIVNKLDSLSQNVALLEENHRSEIESLVELKQSILQEAFNGTL